jgi:protein-S-isoprenylcysteine O-methyltransferase Ste14
VVLIAAMMAAGIKGSGWPKRSRGVRMTAACVSSLGGLYLLGDGIGRLGWPVTPFPKPVEESELKRTGAFGLVRHPMYGGALLLTLGWSLATSPVALVPWAAALAFLDAKRRREEAWLAEKHPEYEEYRASVRHSLLPFVW